MIEKKPIFALAFLVFVIILLWFKTTQGRKIPDNDRNFDTPAVEDFVSGISFKEVKKKYSFENRMITTNIDSDLQNRVEKELSRFKKIRIGRPVEVVIRAVDPENGNVLLAANFKEDHQFNFTKMYPAASLFKIVSAAGVIDLYGYNSDTKLYYNGACHTLYKSQLTKRRNRYTNKTCLKKAFAKSVNPVFGKIGNILGSDKLYYYSGVFGFNDEIHSDFPLKLGKTKEIKKKYHIAETASGFNRETMITPIFAALISSSIINDGILFKPHLIKNIKDDKGILIYRSKPEIYKEILRGRTLRELRKLMKRTVRNGTARKSFRRARYDKYMKNLVIGGKTGSINNKNNTVRYDWFAGFARDKKSKKSIAVSVLVLHGKYIGKRSSDYAYFVIKNFFKYNRA